MAESLQFSVGADTKNFQDGIGGILTGLAGLAAAFVSVQAVVNAFSDAIDMGGRLHDLSTRTGETAGNLAILERAFDNTSVGAEKLGPAINKMQKSMTDMASGSKEAVAAFTQLGLSWSDLEGKSPAEQMELIGIRLAAIENPALRAETAMNIFGKSGAELLPILINFSAETAQATEQLGSLPGQLDASAASVDSLGDNLNAISNKLTELAYGFLSEVVPAVEAFTGKLAGVDAASIGAGLADALIGAFVDPMKAAELLGEVLVLGVKTMGNELVFQARYWSEILFSTFSIIGSEIIPIIGNNMTGAFAMAAGSLGVAIAGILEPFASMLGIDSLQDLATASQELIEQGAAKIADSSNAFASAFEAAKASSTVIQEDIFGAEGSSAKIAADFASLQKSAKDAIAELANPIQISQGTVFSQSGTELLDAITADDAKKKVSQTPITVSTGGGGGKTVAQIQAEQMKQLGLVAGANATQAVGQSFSAQKAIDLQKELDTMAALGKTDTAEYAAKQQSLQVNKDIVAGIALTSEDQIAAASWAFDQFFAGSTESMADLQTMAEENILERKREGDISAADAQKDKAKGAGAGGGAAKEKQQSMMSLVQQLIGLVQKIEPKIPQHIMS